MNKLWIVVLVLSLSACGGSQNSAGYEYACTPATMASATCQPVWLPTVDAFGESISLGFAGRARLDLADVADYRHDDWDNENIVPVNRNYYFGEVVAKGINDGNSAQLLERMEASLVGRYYTIIVMNSVTHDIVTVNADSRVPRISLTTYRFNLEAAAQVAETHASIVIWFNTPPIPDGSLGPYVQASEVESYNAVADDVAREHGFYVLTLPGTDHLPDNVHYTGDGYALLGQGMADCVLTALANGATAACHR